jgi:hypothetical protein
VERLLGSNQKMRRLTGWQPQYTQTGNPGNYRIVQGRGKYTVLIALHKIVGYESFKQLLILGGNTK